MIAAAYQSLGGEGGICAHGFGGSNERPKRGRIPGVGPEAKSVFWTVGSIARALQNGVA